MPKGRKEHSSGQTWATFLKNQASDIWACDFTVAYDSLFRQWYIFVVMELKARQIMHTGVTQYPTDEWMAQQLRESTPLDQVVKEYTTYFNQARPHQGIAQCVPNHYHLPKSQPTSGRITSKAILGGLHHSYSRTTYLNRLISFILKINAYG